MTDAEQSLNNVLDAYEDVSGWARTVDVSEGDKNAVDEVDKAIERLYTLLQSLVKERRDARKALPVFAAFIETLDLPPADEAK